ncbi:acyl-CoA dehydrogenase [Nonomuraea sp. 3N208]|uniref:acyl-CoA dehydrogenase n=1 Tax=Nonomuraea sp. 3N208 TaxID=3457421 RepID=UPI003FD074DB
MKERLARLEHMLGDPWEPGNPVGFRAVLAADERAEMCAAGESVLDAYGLNAEFVPEADGGRLTRLDDLVEIMRAVYRRDPCLGLGYGASSFIAGVNVWSAGDAAQRARVAALLLDNRRVASAYHELAHGNDMAGTECAALPGAGGLVLNGRKEVVTNLQRADALVLFARTDPGPGSRSHSQLLVEKSRLPEGSLRYLPRFATVGMRGVQLGGVEFTGCPLSSGDVIGFPGQGLETAMRSFQVTRTVLPAMMTGILDTALRTTLRFTLSRTLYGAPAADLPSVRASLVGAFVDLLTCEVFALAATRALHVLPGETSVLAAAAKYGVSGVVLDAVHRLSLVLGARSYLREGEYAIFQKLLRDVQPIGFGHAARAACQMTMLPQLPLLARRSWGSAEPAPAAMFRAGAELPPLPFDRLRITAGGRDSLSAGVAAWLDSGEAAGEVTERLVRRLAEGFLAELRDLAGQCADLPPHERTYAASSDTYDLTTRYVRVLMAAACLETWRHNRRDRLLGDPGWLAAALSRLADRSAPLPDHIEKSLFAELLERHETGKSLGLYGRATREGAS